MVPERVAIPPDAPQFGAKDVEFRPVSTMLISIALSTLHD